MLLYLLLFLTSFLELVFSKPSSSAAAAYITDWGIHPGFQDGPSVPLPPLGAPGVLSGSGMGPGSRLNPPTCLSIPENLTLCQGIGYNQMRLPNLLEHDTMAEVSQQAVSWVPLYNLKCHPDTQLFLCSLFTPVCLDRLIFPCRSLCNAVQQGCEGRMKAYGYPWPDMVRCDKFPLDNDMCIGVQTVTPAVEPSPCSICQQPETYENIIDNYCRADFVIKTRQKRLNKSQLKCKKAKVLKLRQDLPKKDFRRHILQHRNLSFCCGHIFRNVGKKGRLLIMGIRVPPSQGPPSQSRPPIQEGGTNPIKYTPTFVMEWGKTKDFRKALKTMRKIDCASPKLLSADGGSISDPGAMGITRRLAKPSPSDEGGRGPGTGGGGLRGTNVKRVRGQTTV